MGVLFIFILISVLVVSALLYFNKGEKAQSIKSILKDIYENFKELFSNIKKLFLIIKELIQSKLEQEPTQLKDDSATEESPEETSSNESNETQPEAITDSEILPTSEGEITLEDSLNPNNEDEKLNNF